MGTIGIAVFGSSEPRPGEPDYERARRVGAGLAGAGYTVVTGGYGGVMEGASRGAVEAGGRTVGVTCSLFGDREPNPYLGERIDCPDLYSRTRRLIDGARGYVVLPGKAGTLAELAWLWALARAGCLDRRPVVLLGDAWERLVSHLLESAVLEQSQREVTHLAETAESAVELLSRLLAEAGWR